MERRLRHALRRFAEHQVDALRPGGPDEGDEPAAEVLAQFEESDSGGFSRFCTALVGFHVAPYGEDVQRGYTDGLGDFSIDGIFIILNDQVVETNEQAAALSTAFGEAEPSGSPELKLVFVQAKMSAFPQHGDVYKFRGDVQRFLKAPEHDLKKARMREELLERARAVRTLTDGRSADVAVSVRLVFAFAGEVRADDNVDAEQARAQEEANLSETLGWPVQYEFWGADELLHAYQAARLATKKRLTDVSLMPLPVGGPSGFMGYVSGKALADFIKRPNERGQTHEDHLLFYENVRHHLGNHKTNVGAAALAATLESSERTHVIVRNNGVTIIALGAEIEGPEIELIGAQIVNGAQTSVTLLRNYHRLEGVHVPIKIVIAPDEATKIGVIKGANTQATVDDYDMLAIERTVRDLQATFDFGSSELPDKVWMRRRRNEWVYGVRERWDRVVSPRDLMEAFAATFLGAPHEVHADPKLLLTRVPSEIFNRTHENEAYRYLAWLLAAGRDWGRRSNAPWTGGDKGSRYPARHQMVFALHRIIDRETPFPRTPGGSYDLTRTGLIAKHYRDLCGRLAGRDGRALANDASKVVEAAFRRHKKPLTQNQADLSPSTPALKTRVLLLHR
jgi:hypothetical protein